MSNNNHAAEPAFAEKLTQRRQPQHISLLRCPISGSSLIQEGDMLVSQTQPEYRYPIEAGLVRLSIPDQRKQFDEQSRSRSARYQAEGYQVADGEMFRRLPQTALNGWPPGYWSRRAFITAEMWRVLEDIRVRAERLPIGPMGTALDLTDGMGWIGYGLDVSGYITLVVGEQNGPYGLDVFPYSRYLRVQASLSAPPVAAEQFDLVVFSFSLETLDQPMQAIEKALKLLKQRGHLVVLADKVDATQADMFQAIEAVLNAPGYKFFKHRVGAMGRNLTRKLKNAVGRLPDVPPVLVVQREGG